MHTIFVLPGVVDLTPLPLSIGDQPAATPALRLAHWPYARVQAPWLDDRSVVFGYLANAESFEALDKMEKCGGESGEPSTYIQVIVPGGGGGYLPEGTGRGLLIDGFRFWRHNGYI